MCAVHGKQRSANAVEGSGEQQRLRAGGVGVPFVGEKRKVGVGSGLKK